MENKNTQVEYDLLQTEENSKDEVKNEKIIFNNLNLKKYTQMLRLADLLKGIDSLAKNCETKFSVQVKDIKEFSGKLDLIQV